MNETEVQVYQMNPAEDTLLFGDELREGMWVLLEDYTIRRPYKGEDSLLRRQRFSKVTKLRIESDSYNCPTQVVFIGEWVDGYQARQSAALMNTWIVKKEGNA